jgi:prephenate dehydratase
MIKRARDVTRIVVREDLELNEHLIETARRTAFIARFIVLRESKRTKAHRKIEMLSWKLTTKAESLAEAFRQIFISNGDNMELVERDIRRALAHANRSITFFVDEYSKRATITFIAALEDYQRSNDLLFGADDQPKPGGWHLPLELQKEKKKKSPNFDFPVIT